MSPHRLRDCSEAPSVRCTENARDIAGLRSQVADAEAGLACGHDCGGYSCPTLQADWKREGFSCSNAGCPAEQATG